MAVKQQATGSAEISLGHACDAYAAHLAATGELEVSAAPEGGLLAAAPTPATAETPSTSKRGRAK